MSDKNIEIIKAIQETEKIIYHEYGVSFVDENDKEAQYEHTRANDVATKIVSAGRAKVNRNLDDLTEKLNNRLLELQTSLDKYQQAYSVSIIDAEKCQARIEELKDVLSIIDKIRGQEGMPEITQVLDEAMYTLNKNIADAEEYRQILAMISKSAKEGEFSINVQNLSLYSMICLRKNGFRIKVHETSHYKLYNIYWG